MNNSLSVLLPVHNAEATLDLKVSQILDVVPELSRQFDVLIIDDGSTDATAEVAHDLALRFPQVSVARHSTRLGLAKALQTGLLMTRGEIIFVHDQSRDLEPTEIVRLWQQRNVSAQIATRTDSGSTARPSWLGKLMPRRGELRPAGFHMLRRQSLASLEAQSTRADQGHAAMPKPARARIMSEIKKFALGE